MYFSNSLPQSSIILLNDNYKIRVVRESCAISIKRKQRSINKVIAFYLHAMVFTSSYYKELTNHSVSQMNDIWGRDRVLQIIQSVDILTLLFCYRGIFYFLLWYVYQYTTACLGAQKNRLTETDLLSTRNMRSA